ncbi:YL1 nuclear [Metarhizium album ARSEF 1941]|uniref:YL1 nuclear n=1 Tax=Metarhizium album (strain ARSEF 1941) TaxID=1081103 RepID=A0A0B2WUB7_METAS|nr:YL1 nuclear [Metarhizium album ARSEF 1941]KHN97658.1 YL1 nuclear [Metarhizium album ARSEF 1941]
MEDPSMMDTESKTSDRDTSQLSDPPSDLDGSDRDAPTQQTEWLATTRKRRSTAGNRMKSMLANEEPDSDLELLFAEDENDQGFSDVGDDGSDVHMDSSSDDEDDNNANDDDLEGEKELDRQAKEKRAALRKRRAQEAIPAKFRKKVRIDPTTRAASVPAPAPRPKKKSERASWLPSPADLPTRASSRKTTRISKEQLHQQMAEREAKRLKQLAQMEKKAARLEAMKKPPMTQEERLAEAAIVEKRNSKSLNRWEEAEKQREEERKAKLAALNQRTLKGPVLTFWSGKGQWEDVELRSLRPYVTEVEEKPKKKREKTDKTAKGKGKGKDKDGAKTYENQVHREGDKDNSDGIAQARNQSSDVLKAVRTSTTEKSALSDPKNLENDGSLLAEKNERHASVKAGVDGTEAINRAASTEARLATADDASNSTDVSALKPNNTPIDAKPETQEDAILVARDQVEKSTQPSRASPLVFTPLLKEETIASTDFALPQPSASGPPSSPIPSSISAQASTTPPSHPPSRLAAPLPPPPAGPLVATAGPTRPAEARPSRVLAAPVLILPPVVDIDTDPSSPVDAAPKSNVLAPPNTFQSTLAPPSVQPGNPTTVAASSVSSATKITTEKEVDTKGSVPAGSDFESAHGETATTSMRGSPEPPAVTEAPRDMDATRNGIIYQNFDGNAIRDKNIQTQILFGRKMTKLAKPAPAPICVITNNPARYRDPQTKLPFYNMFAYKEIQRLNNGDYQWSRILGAWVGNPKQAARGVPERFLNPDGGKLETPGGHGNSKIKQREQSEKRKEDEAEAEDGGMAQAPAAAGSDAAVEAEEISGTVQTTEDVLHVAT